MAVLALSTGNCRPVGNHYLKEHPQLINKLSIPILLRAIPIAIRIWWKQTPVGTKSILVGAHQFIIHPIFVFLSWWILYGFPLDPLLWFAFITHDLGYWSLPNMDGPEGEEHVHFAANLMGRLFGPEWSDFCRYHSRFQAKRDGKPFSRLCVADKLACALEPWWLYLPRVWASGELWEYMALAGGRNGGKYAGEPNSKYVSMQLETGTIRGWHRGMTTYLREWVAVHRDGRTDTWTPAAK